MIYVGMWHKSIWRQFRVCTEPRQILGEEFLVKKCSKLRSYLHIIRRHRMRAPPIVVFPSTCPRALRRYCPTVIGA
jgi:hypothetical protein